jgi:F0F1-type ATP synthase membrane subunit c/vacuolar-type H+-ATPase subunit K
MGLVMHNGHIATWLRIHVRVFAVLVALSVGGALVAPMRIAARSQSLSGPTFSTAILLPCLGATFAIYLSLPFAPVLDLTAARSMSVWRAAQALLALVAGLILVAPGALLASGDTARIFQNLGVFAAAGMVLARMAHPLLGVVVPWLWALGALLFGLSYSDLGNERWAWWSWIIGSDPAPFVGLLIGCLGAAMCGYLPRRRRLHQRAMIQ